jgi:hypothetical protein
VSRVAQRLSEFVTRLLSSTSGPHAAHRVVSTVNGKLATLMGLEPTASCVTGMFRFVSRLSVDVSKRPSYRALTRGADSADIRSLCYTYATPRLNLERFFDRLIFRPGPAFGRTHDLLRDTDVQINFTVVRALLQRDNREYPKSGSSKRRQSTDQTRRLVSQDGRSRVFFGRPPIARGISCISFRCRKETLA